MAFRNKFIQTVVGSTALVGSYFGLDVATKKVYEDKQKTYSTLEKEGMELALESQDMTMAVVQESKAAQGRQNLNEYCRTHDTGLYRTPNLVYSQPLMDKYKDLNTQLEKKASEMQKLETDMHRIEEVRQILRFK